MQKIFTHYLPLFLASLLLCGVSLPQLSGAGTRRLLALLLISFIFFAFLTLPINFFLQKGKQSFFEAIKSYIQKIKIQKIDLAVLLMFLSAVTATISSYFFTESISGLIKYFLYFLFYISICLAITSKNAARGIILAALIGLIWANFEGFTQYLFGAEALATWEDPEVHFSQRLNRVYSSFLNPNLYGTYLVALWPLSFVFAPKLIELIKDTTQKQNVKIFSLLGLIICALLFLSSIFLAVQTGSRGTWLSIAAQFGIIGLALLFFVRSKFISIGFWSLTATAIIYIMSKPSFFNRLLSIFSSYEHSSNSFRLNVWKACWQMFLDNPLFGIGPGSKSFYQAYAIYSDSIHSSLGAYSLPLEIAVEMGILGVITFLFFIFVVACSGIQRLRGLKNNLSQGKSEDLILLIALLISLTGLLINGLFDIVILRPQIQIILWTIVALVRFHIIQLNSSQE